MLRTESHLHPPAPAACSALGRRAQDDCKGPLMGTCEDAEAVETCLSTHPPIQHPIRHRFRHMLLPDLARAPKIRDRARQA